MKNSHNNNYKTIKLFEAFSGIGAQYQALKNIENQKKWKVVSVGIVEWFIPAIITYQAIHYWPKTIKKETFVNQNNVLSNDSKKLVSDDWFIKNTKSSYLGFWLNQSKEVAKNLFDISKINPNNIPDDIDIFTYSFPCQDISNQGKQKGFNKGSKTRSGLLWEIERLLINISKNKNKNMPKYLLMENVKSIINKNHIDTFNKWKQRLENLGYESKQYILNAADFGNCQNRERVFLLSILKDYKEKINFEFKEIKGKKTKKPLTSILEKKNIQFNKKFNKYSLQAIKVNSSNIKKYLLKNYTNFQSENFVFDINYSGPTLTASGALSRIKLFYGKNKIREMLPIECFRYMGFSDKAYNLAKKTKLVNDNKLIYLCGNSINVKVLEAIFNNLEFE